MYLRLYLTLGALALSVYMVLAQTHIIKPPPVLATTLPTYITVSICGDGLLNSGEVCDDGFGFNVGGYGSSTGERHCNAGCLSFGPYCGDGILQVRFTEQCDDNNNTSGDLCSAQCLAEIPAAPPPIPTLGAIPASGGPVGNISAQIETRVVLRGKAIPNADVNILLDGELLEKVRADVNADFQFTTSAITPGTATFGFWTADSKGTKSITSTVIFEVVQSAVTTVANVLIPPTITLSETKIAPGELLTVSGESVPNTTVVSDISGVAPNTLTAEVEASGAWAFQVDTNSLSRGFNTIKPLFQIDASTKSGYGRALSFYVGTEDIGAIVSPDFNDDGRINLVDFSIFLLGWGGDEARFDFNQDSAVNLADFSIMLFNWTG